MKSLSIVLLLSLPLAGQNPVYDFYRDARDKKPEDYAAELRTADVPEDEIARRLDLRNNHRALLEADRGTVSTEIQQAITIVRQIQFLTTVVSFGRPTSPSRYI